MLLNPSWVEQDTQAAIDYSNLSRNNWGTTDRDIHYYYDANGSMTSKVITGTSNNKSYAYDYNLRNQLKCVTTSYTSGGNNISEVTEYAYNDDGIRVKSVYKEYVNSVLNNNSIETKVFLVDSQNHTGYSQVLEELIYDHTQPNPNPLTDAPTSRKTYTIGDDVITQSTGNNPQHLLYDGHGSTRQLAEVADGQQRVGVSEYYSYDAYGVMVDGNPTSASPTQTNMLYAGEQWDNSAQMYYLRARYYDPLNGRFNQLDPYAGNNEDPQSLHKYLYCHANPVNGIDPGGNEMSLIGLVAVNSIIGALIGGLIGGIDSALGGGSFWSGFGWGALFGGAAGAALALLPMTLLVKSLLGGIVVVSTAIGAINSFMNGNYLQGFFRILVGLVSLGLLVRAPTCSTPRITLSQQRALENLGFSIPEAEWFAAGKLTVTRIGNPGGSDTAVLAQFVNGRLKVGIHSIEDTSGTGAQAFMAFRTFAFDIARALGVNEVELFGSSITNPEVRAMLVRQGFRPAVLDVPPEVCIYQDQFDILIKTVTVH
jgi:RHS repeat-associated protein